MSDRQFERFRASALWCRRCAASRPVRERLLLVLPDREKYEYLCTECGDAVGAREVHAAEQVLRRETAGGGRGPQVRIL